MRLYPKEYQPTHVVIESGTCMGLMVLAEEIYTLAKWRLYQYIGAIDPAIINQIDKAVCVSLGLPAPTREKRCLCARCLRDYQESHKKLLKRVNRYQTTMDTCDFCQQRPGYDYWIYD